MFLGFLSAGHPAWPLASMLQLMSPDRGNRDTTRQRVAPSDKSQTLARGGGSFALASMPSGWSQATKLPMALTLT